MILTVFYILLLYKSVYRNIEVVKVRTEDDKERYFVADENGLPIEPIYQIDLKSLYLGQVEIKKNVLTKKHMNINIYITQNKTERWMNNEKIYCYILNFFMFNL